MTPLTVADATKSCSRCGQTKARREFSPNTRHSSGLQSRCKACVAEVHRAKRGSDAELRRRERQASAAFRVAAAELRDRHRQEFDDIYTALLMVGDSGSL